MIMASSMAACENNVAAIFEEKPSSRNWLTGLYQKTMRRNININENGVCGGAENIISGWLARKRLAAERKLLKAAYQCRQIF